MQHIAFNTNCDFTQCQCIATNICYGMRSNSIISLLFAVLFGGIKDKSEISCCEFAMISVYIFL